MKRHHRPERFNDRHLSIAQLLVLKETGEKVEYPSREFRVRAEGCKGAATTLRPMKWIWFPDSSHTNPSRFQKHVVMAGTARCFHRAVVHSTAMGV